MPRNRTVRLAVLGSSVQRAATSKYASRSATVLKRRVVVGVLVMLSLLLITVYFREPQTGGLHTLQTAGATALKPFQVGAERVARPFRDLYGYLSGLVSAKSENERLREENKRLEQEAIQGRAAIEENKTLRELADFHAPGVFPGDYRAIAAAVVSHPSPFEQEVVIAAGATHGVRLNDPVVNADGLVGKVSFVTDDTARVTLLTDGSSAVSAEDVDTNAGGIVRPGRAGSGSLILDFVEKRYIVREGDEIITAGSQRGEKPSLYPRGIKIGTVTFVNQTNVDQFKRIQLRPAVDFGALDAVIVLVPQDELR